MILYNTMKMFTPGPIAMDDETLNIGGLQSQYFRTQEFSEVLMECDTMLKKILDAPEGARTIFLTASGTAAMEATVINLFTAKDRVLVLNGGTFGERFKKICEVHTISCESIDLKWNEAFNPAMLGKYTDCGITGMLINMCETSTGQLFPIDVIAKFCKRNKICLVVDAISAFLSDPFSMVKSGADAVIISSQKGLGLHPGMAFVVITEKAFNNRVASSDVRSLYFDFKNYCADILRGQTPYTVAVNIINQLHEKLQRLTMKGISESIDHIANLAKHFRQCISCQDYFTIPDYYPLSNSLTPIYCPQNDAKQVFDYLLNQNIYITPCAGEISQFLFRIAHMSQKLGTEDIDDLVKLLKKSRENQL